MTTIPWAITTKHKMKQATVISLSKNIIFYNKGQPGSKQPNVLNLIIEKAEIITSSVTDMPANEMLTFLLVE